MAHANLLRFLPPAPLRVLDAGGGNGLDSLPLARRGDHVTLLDFSAEMLDEAERIAQEQGVSNRLDIHRGDLSSLPDLASAGILDLVLCHNVLQYVEDVDAALRILIDSLCPGGLLSIILVNRYAEVYRNAIQLLDPALALDRLDAQTHTAGMFGVAVPHYAAEDFMTPLAELGCTLLGRFGIRCFTDYIVDNERKSDPGFYADLERLELAVSDRFPYYLTGRFFQLIVRKALVKPTK